MIALKAFIFLAVLLSAWPVRAQQFQLHPRNNTAVGAELTANKNTDGGYPGLKLSAGPWGAGSCDASGQWSVDTTGDDVGICADGAGGTPIDIATLGDAYTSIDDGTNSATASGAESKTYRRASTLDTEVEVFNGTGTFTNQPSNDGVEIVSSAAGDTTQTVTIYGTTNGADQSETIIETVSLNGTTVVSTTKTDWGNVLAVKKSASTTGTITFREASGDLAITTLAPATLRAANKDTVFYKGGPVFKRTTSDATLNNSVTMTAVAALNLAVLSGEVWYLDYVLHYDATTVADIDFDVSYPSGSTGRMGMICAQTGATGASASTQRNTTYALAGTDLTNQTCGGVGAGTGMIAFFRGVIIAGAHGTISLRFAQGTQEATNTNVLTGSTLKAHKE